ncbi:MAG: hypothetical protein ACI9OJ_003485 [Myxococcota bacterium]
MTHVSNHRRPQLPRRRLRNNERGSLLLISMMVIMVLAGLGIIGARNTMLELRQVGNFRAAEQALRASESGIEASMALAVTRGDAFPAYVAANGNKLTKNDVSTDFYDGASLGSFGLEKVASVNFVTQMSLPADTNRVPGYPVSESFIWKRYRFVTSGFFGSEAGVAATAADTLRNGSRTYASDAFVGPYIVGSGGQ